MPELSVNQISVLEIRLPTDNEYILESMSALLANFSQTNPVSFWGRLLGRKNTIASLEIVLLNGQIHFCLAAPTNQVDYLRSQVLAQYPTAALNPVTDYLATLPSPLFVSQITLSKSSKYPLKTAKDFVTTDPINSVLAPLSRSTAKDDFFVFQIILAPPPKNWQSSINYLISEGILVDKETGRRQSHPDKALFEQKIQFPGLNSQINFLSNNSALISSVSASFGAYTSPRGNLLKNSQPGPLSKKRLQTNIQKRILSRRFKSQVLNTEELSALWHPPGLLTKLPNIAWGQSLYSQPPENLPVATDATPEEKNEITFVGKTEFRNTEAIFGIHQGEDRRRHTYIIGKSGTGKTTLIANMAIDDIRKGRGVAVIDPHGDLCNTLLDYIPSSRINDCCYFNPADPDYVYPLNVLEAQNESQRELVASGVISIFKKLYGNISWGPRLEHILRNAVLTLVNTPDTTMVDIVEILTNQRFRNKIVDQLQNQTLKNFWVNEFDRMDQKFQNEAVSPILNKVGQFIASTNIRNTINHPHSKVKIQDIMDNKKILIADLSSGKLGEDNSALLGAMIITQIQLSAMNRVFMAEEARPDFYLYVDEFQNFATESFIKILSEARKFRLNLIMANQYMAQLDKTIQDAIFGNVGSLMSFVVGNQDAFVLEKEFGKEFPGTDLVKLGKYQIVTRLSIDSETSNPFYAHTLPPLSCKNQGRDKLIRTSQQRWGKKK
ncbi:type IV secretion system DNA-binding domain-containing protein [Patescibacteria group bacterium]|nr:type IV secretion system DNA-binding domain-containing protein [Patescibacteria group bacterium]